VRPPLQPVRPLLYVSRSRFFRATRSLFRFLLPSRRPCFQQQQPRLFRSLLPSRRPCFITITHAARAMASVTALPNLEASICLVRALHPRRVFEALVSHPVGITAHTHTQHSVVVDAETQIAVSLDFGPDCQATLLRCLYALTGLLSSTKSFPSPISLLCKGVWASFLPQVRRFVSFL
jgi:hypothetical protein